MLITKVDHPGWTVKYPNNPEGEWVQHGAHGSAIQKVLRVYETALDRFKDREPSEKIGRSRGHPLPPSNLTLSPN